MQSARTAHRFALSQDESDWRLNCAQITQVRTVGGRGRTRYWVLYHWRRWKCSPYTVLTRPCARPHQFDSGPTQSIHEGLEATVVILEAIQTLSAAGNKNQMMRSSICHSRRDWSCIGFVDG